MIHTGRSVAHVGTRYPQFHDIHVQAISRQPPSEFRTVSTESTEPMKWPWNQANIRACATIMKW